MTQTSVIVLASVLAVVVATTTVLAVGAYMFWKKQSRAQKDAFNAWNNPPKGYAPHTPGRVPAESDKALAPPITETLDKCVTACDTTADCTQLLYNAYNNRCTLYPSTTHTITTGPSVYDSVYLFKNSS